MAKLGTLKYYRQFCESFDCADIIHSCKTLKPVTKYPEVIYQQSLGVEFNVRSVKVHDFGIWNLSFALRPLIDVASFPYVISKCLSKTIAVFDPWSY